MIYRDSFKITTNNSVKDSRMEARYAAFRFIYFFEQYLIESPTGLYTGDIEKTLDEYIHVYIDRKKDDVINYVRIYDDSMKIIFKFFGEHSFRKVDPYNINGRKSPINKLMLLTFTILISKHNYTTIQSKIPQKVLVRRFAQF